MRLPPGLSERSSSSIGLAVSISPSQVSANSSGGAVNSTCPSYALNSSRNESPTTGSPRESGLRIALPFKKTPNDLAKPESQSSSDISLPAGLNHTMSATPPVPRRDVPLKNRRRLNTGFSRRSLATLAVKSTSAQLSLASSQ